MGIGRVMNWATLVVYIIIIIIIIPKNLQLRSLPNFCSVGEDGGGVVVPN